MRAVDTNILIRLVTKDDLAQAKRAQALFSKQSIFIPKTILLETAWVLQYVYDYEKHTILHALRGILGLSNVEIEDPLIVAQALAWMEGGLDFADALHVASSQPAQTFVTFDEKLQKKAKTLTGIPVELL
jgi:predicted nucleic-acid-binding protein